MGWPITKELMEDFRKYLKKHKERLAIVQAAGYSCEDYFVKEFINFFNSKNPKEEFATVNIGKPRIDICLLKRKKLNEKELEIRGMLEAKYFSNVYRLWYRNRNNSPSLAKGKYQGTFNSLQTQLYNPLKEGEHGGLKVSKSCKSIYGLVFASYVEDKKGEWPKNWKEGKKDFYGELTEIAKKRRKHWKKGPNGWRRLEPCFGNKHFKSAYEDVTVPLLDENLKVSLRVGLWQKSD